ncbi:hypothetical protein JRO89_XS15G0137700 [Xanthoceras sorbifolium]|uniref:MORF/ORRM1/DAG-like MORF domain-containing protein n=1 Tax=Xanthoceras sorbifolium TaxID=99658 RepID=A0ABQ8H219_9ROSI|nr:hypothetical protein JRO89_XS15G0137700 [Xanthoceras sorbifolium]
MKRISSVLFFFVIFALKTQAAFLSSTMATLHAPSLLIHKPLISPRPQLTLGLRFNSLRVDFAARSRPRSILTVKAGPTDSEYSSRRSSSNEPRETIMLPGCDYNHWLIVMEFPKDPAPTREQMIDTYLNTLATVLGSMEEAKKNMYAFSTTTYTGFQCTVSEETSEKFKGLPGVLWVLPDSYIDVKNKDYGVYDFKGAHVVGGHLFMVLEGWGFGTAGGGGKVCVT